jgi:hypothetical protein
VVESLVNNKTAGGGYERGFSESSTTRGLPRCGASLFEAKATTRRVCVGALSLVLPVPRVLQAYPVVEAKVLAVPADRFRRAS